MAESSTGMVAPKHRLAGWRRWVARAVLVVLAPALGLLLLEGVLRVAGYGIPTTFFLRSPDGHVLVLNERFSWQFAPKEIAPAGHPLRFPAKKKAGIFRIFILGESAAMGTPEPAFGFGRILREMLREQHPGMEFEVINCAMTAINSHIVLPIAREAAGQEGDLYIVYMGNNEVTGPFGPLTIYKRYTPSLRLIRASIWAKSTRTGQWIASLLGGQKPVLQEWKGMENWAANRIALDDPQREGVYAHYRVNLRDILEAVTARGSSAIVCTMAINLKDCPPFASLHRRGLTEAEENQWKVHFMAGVAAQEKQEWQRALEQFRQAAHVDPDYAELRYRIGQCLIAAGDAPAAQAEYSAARDLDALQFRTDSHIQHIIRETAGQFAARRVKLADVEAAFAASPLAAKGIPGDALLWEHVHMTFAGNYVIARTLLPLVAEAMSKPPAKEPPSEARCAERLCYTPFDESQCISSIHGMMARPPFTGQAGHAGRLAELAARVQRLDLSSQTRERALSLYAGAIQRNADDWELHLNYAARLGDAGKFDAAGEHLDAVARLIPAREARLRQVRAKLLLREGKADEALAAFEDLIRTESDTADHRLNLGFAYILKGKAEEAEAALREALRQKPEMTAALNALGSAMLLKNDLPAAEAEYRKALAVMEEPDTHVNLATVLKRQGKPEEAVKHLRRAAAMNPNWAVPRFKLAGMMMEAGDSRGAYFELKATVALDPRHGQAHAILVQMLMPRGTAPTEEALRHMRGAYEAGGASPELLSAYAWYLAVHADPSFRDGDLALKVAEEACGKMKPPSASLLRSLAAAYAEKGRFDEAARTARQARDVAMKTNQSAIAKGVEADIAAYEGRRTIYQRR